MPSITGSVVQEGYQVIYSAEIQGYGYALAISNPPQLPENPYFGYTYPLQVDPGGNPPMSGMGRKIYRDGVFVFPPYAGVLYDLVVIWRAPSVGLNWYLRW